MKKLRKIIAILLVLFLQGDFLAYIVGNQYNGWLRMMATYYAWAAVTKYVDGGCTTTSAGIATYVSATRACTGGAETVYQGIKWGITGLGAGNTLRIRTGTYLDSAAQNQCVVNAWTGGSVGSPSIVENYPSEVVTWDVSNGSCAIANNTADNYLTIRSDVRGNFTITGGTDANDNHDSNMIGIGQNGGNFFTIENMVLLNWKYSTTGGGTSLVAINGTNAVIRNNELGNVGKLWNGEAEAGSLAPHAIYIKTTDHLIERNYIHDIDGYGIHAYDPAAKVSRVISRYNYIFRTGRSQIAQEAGILSAGDDNQIYGNVIILSDSQAVGVVVGFSSARAQVYNNTIAKRTGGSCAFNALFITQTFSEYVNNIHYPACTSATSGTIATNSNNLATDPSYTNYASDDLTLASGSPAIDAGIASIRGTCNGTCDQGAFETLSLASCTVEDGDASTMRITFTNNVAPPLTGLTLANWSTRKATVSNAPTAIALTGSNRVDLTLTNAIVAGNAIDFTYTPGTLTDSSLIGGTLVQKVFSFTQQSCTNNVGSAPTGTWEQKAFAVHGLRGTEAAPIRLPHAAAATNSNAKVIPGGYFRLRAAIIRNTADTLSFSPQWRCSLTPISTGIPGAQTAVPDTFGADNIKFIGASDTSADIPTQATVTTNLLGAVGAGSFVAGAILRTSSTIPAVSIAPTNWTEIEGVFQLDTDAAANDTYDCRLYTDAGVALDTYTQTPRITVIAAQAGSGF